MVRGGDVNFSGPHVYCHFDFDRQPYVEVRLHRQYSEENERERKEWTRSQEEP
jgi:hypothetical protein